MRTLSALVPLVILLAGCANLSSPSTADNAPMHTQGTAIGASFQGVNQGTNTTDATRSSDTPR